jgi:hypothetical protein
MVRCGLVLGWLGLCCAVVGCAVGPRQLSPPIRSGEPIGVQIMRTEPSLVGTPFRVLIDFESDSDLAFLADGHSATRDPEVAHTGAASLRLPAGSSVAVKLSAMLSASNFPAAWTLGGAYFISREPATVTATYEVDGKALLHRTVTLEPRKWTPVMLDLSPLNDPNVGVTSRDVGVLKFKAERAEAWCDDVVLIDNAHTLVGESAKPGDNWTVRQRGFSTLIERPGSFSLAVPTPEESPGDGWVVVEANEMRVVFAGDGGGKRVWAIYSDGRAYLNGKVKPVMPLPPDRVAALEQQQASPAQLQVPDEFGRVERNAPGDRNNDGYAEMTGAYELKASGPRMRVTITPQTPRLVTPVLEIAGLPPQGRVTAYMEGQLIESIVRLHNGHVLVEIPATLTKSTTLDVRVQ